MTQPDAANDTAPNEQASPVQPVRPRRDWRGRLVVLALSGLCFVLACALPALRLSGDRTEVMLGAQALALGWLAILIGQFAWFANPLWVISLILLCFRRWVATAIVAVLAFIVAADTWLLFGEEIPGDEGGVTKLYLDQIDIAYYFWVVSMLIVAVGALILRARTPNQSTVSSNQLAVFTISR